MWVIVTSSRKPLGTAGHVAKMLPAESEKKMDDFEPIYLGNYRF